MGLDLNVDVGLWGGIRSAWNRLPTLALGHPYSTQEAPACSHERMRLIVRLQCCIHGMLGETLSLSALGWHLPSMTVSTGF